MARVKFSYENIKKYHLDIIKGTIDEALQLFETEAKTITPEDTKKMLWSYETKSEPYKNWNKEGSKATVKNKAEYAAQVEYWVWVPFNYHKPKGKVFYRWAWNATFRRTTDNNKNKITDILFRKLKW